MENQISNDSKLLAGVSYAFGLPAIYVLLTDKRKEEFLFFHSAQAMILWIGIVLIWMLMRILLVIIWNVIYIPFLDNLVSLIGFAIWLFAVRFGYMAFKGRYFKIPYISKIIKKIIG